MATIHCKAPLRAVWHEVGKHLRTAASLAALLISAPVLAQTGGAGAAPVVFSIPSQSLQSALVTLADQADLQIVMTADVGGTEPTTEVAGVLSPAQALDRLLSGTGLDYQLSGGTLTIVQAPAADAAAPAVARAEAAAPAAAISTEVEEIVVTAQGREQRLQDVPISVAVASGDMLEANATRTLEDMASRMPNVKISNFAGASAINIRGVGSGNNLGFEQSVATFVDGVYRGRARAVRMAFFDVDRIEVLRGPQTTYFGNNAIAGALNIITRKPAQSPESNISMLYGTDNEYSFEAGSSQPLNDHLAIRIAGRASGMDGYVRNDLINEDGPGLSHQIGRVALAWTPADRLTVDARIDVGRMRDKGVNNTELIDCPPAAEFGEATGVCARHLDAVPDGNADNRLNHRTVIGPGRFDMDLAEVVLRGAYDLDGHRLTSITGWYDHDYDNLVNVLPTRNSSVTTEPYGLPTRQTEGFQQISQELRLESTGFRKLDYMFGVYYADSDLDVSSGTGFFFAPFGAVVGGDATDPVAVLFENTQRTKVMSAFASSTAHLREDTRLNLGLRYSSVEKDAARSAEAGIGTVALDRSEFTPGTADAQAVLLALTGSDAGDYDQPGRKDTKLMPSVALEYDITGDIMGYVSYSKGFKAGGYSISSSKASFGPETVDAYEVGIKSTFFDRRLTLNLAGFYSQYNDLQESVITVLDSGVGVNALTNVAKSITKGIEFAGLFRATPALSFNFDTSWLSSKYDSYESAPCTSLQLRNTPPGTACSQDLSGKNRAYAPELAGNLGVQYIRAIGGALELSSGASVFYSSDFFTQSTNDALSRQSGYALLDARLALSPPERNWEVALIGKNLADRTVFNYWSTVPTALGSGQALVDRPRSVALQFSMRY